MVVVGAGGRATCRTILPMTHAHSGILHNTVCHHALIVTDQGHALHGLILPIASVHDKEQKMQALENSIRKFGELWRHMFGDHAVTPYVLLLYSHASQLVRIHGSLGDFSNSGLESFHKVVKWLLNKNNIWGGTAEAHVGRDILRDYYKMILLDIEQGDGSILAEMHTGRRWVDCVCQVGQQCRWEMMGAMHEEAASDQEPGE